MPFRPRRLRAPLTIEQILLWADHTHEQTGHWPKSYDDHVLANLKEKWKNIDAALRRGKRRLSGGYSLRQLLADQRGVRNTGNLPDLTELQVLAWAEAHRQRTGDWPNAVSGPVFGAPGEKWENIDAALRHGYRRLPGSDSIALLLARERGHRHRMRPPQLTEDQIAAWVEAHHERTGEWPNYGLRGVVDAPGEAWNCINRSLRKGQRGLPGGDTLGRLIARRFGVRHHADIPRLTVKQILAWADTHRRRTGRWPKNRSGPIADAPGETWQKIANALFRELRGLKVVTSLSRLLAKYRGVRNRGELPRLTLEQVLRWADEHQRRTGQWPTQTSGEVIGSRGETWRAIDTALNHAGRGLPGGETLFQLLTRTGRKATSRR